MSVSLAAHGELLLRIVVGTLLGGVIGYERDLRGRPAGLRTHIVVALASSTFMVVSCRFVYFQGYGPNDLVDVDGSRIASSVVSGIGFLAGGAILRTGLTVQGLTTAAGLWLVAAIGLAAGGGMYLESVAATAIGMVALTLLRRFEDRAGRAVRRRVTLALGPEAAPVAALSARLASLGATVVEQEHERDLADATRVVLLDVRSPEAVTTERLLGALEGEPGLRRIRIESVV